MYNKKHGMCVHVAAQKISSNGTLITTNRWRYEKHDLFIYSNLRIRLLRNQQLHKAKLLSNEMSCRGQINVTSVIHNFVWHSSWQTNLIPSQTALT
jgi:hypothetical protein